MGLKDMFFKRKWKRAHEINPVDVPDVAFGNRLIELIIAKWLGIMPANEPVPNYSEVRSWDVPEELSRKFRVTDRLEKEVKLEVGALLLALGYNSNEKFLINNALPEKGLVCFRTGSQNPFYMELSFEPQGHKNIFTVILQEEDMKKKYLYDYSRRRAFLTKLWNKEVHFLGSEDKESETNDQLYFNGEITTTDMGITVKTKEYIIQINAKYHEYDKAILRNLLDKIYQLIATLSYPITIEELFSKLNTVFPLSNDNCFLRLNSHICNFYLNIAKIINDEMQDMETINYTDSTSARLTCKVEGGTCVVLPQGFEERTGMVVVATSGKEDWNYESSTMRVKQDKTGTHFVFMNPNTTEVISPDTITSDCYSKAHEISLHTAKEAEKKRKALLLLIDSKDE